MKLTLLGTGMPNANPVRRGPSQVIEAGDDLILVDCGAGVAHRLVEAGLGRRSISRLAITHLHSDHITGLADLLWAGWVGRWRDEPPIIAGPPGTKHFVEHLIEAFSYDISVRTKTPGGEGLNREWLVPQVEEIEEDWHVEGNDWRLAAFRVDHVQVDEAFGFRLESESRSIVLSGDTRPSENLIKHAQNADILVHEVQRLVDPQDQPPITDPWAIARREAIINYHTLSTDLGKVAAEANTRHLVLNHIILREGSPTDLLSDIEPDFSGNITVGEDLMTFEP